MAPAILFYDIVLAVHVMAVVVAFGVTFAYPVIETQIKRLQPRALPTWHTVAAKVDGKLVTPAAALALFAGVYMASDRELFDRIWVQVPFAALIIIFGAVGSFLTPQSRKLAELAARDVAASPGDGAVTWSAEYEALSKRVAAVGAVMGGLILLSIFLMVAKPGGY
ncbi:hypothetical protein DSM112329_04996 [Paraconexibacter sp. AEG42_29]|uniref:DUF2269 family protein n=1 Tax=Paraconexibacter sp. AEG42_29 TaxID=2997339 RepID=A0AAU7B2K1_9ACTN